MEIAGRQKSGDYNSLKLTAKAPENRQGPKRKLVFQPSIFRGENVSFREGTLS